MRGGAPPTHACLTLVSHGVWLCENSAGDDSDMHKCHVYLILIQSVCIIKPSTNNNIKFCRLLGVLILLAEAAFIITEVYFVLQDQHSHTVDIFQVLDLVFSAYYSVEVSLRIMGNG
jgi:hypothetical protein